MKAASIYFGSEVMEYMDIPQKVIGIAPTEMVILESRRGYQDFNFIMEDNEWYHFEFESDSINRKDLKRFREYESRDIFNELKKMEV